MSETIEQIAEPTVVPVLMTVKAVCKHFGLSSSTVYRLLDNGAFDSIQQGRSRLILSATVYAWIDRKRKRII